MPPETHSEGGSIAICGDRLDAVLASYKQERGNLIPILQSLQAHFGFVPEAAMKQVAEYLGLSESSVFGVASFYAQFRFQPVGRRKVMVCRGTACHVRGAARVLDEIEKVLGISEGQTTPDREYSLESVACIGCCALAPCVVVDGRTAARVTTRKVKRLFGKAGRDEV